MEKTNQAEFFCVRQVYLKKSCQQLWERVNQHFILFMHHIWGETVIWGAVFIIQTSDKMQYFTIFQDKLHSFNIQNRTKHAWAFSKTVQKISKITYMASRLSLLTSAKFSVNIKRVTLQHNKEFIVYFFLFNGFITMYKRAHFEYSCKRCLWTTENKQQSNYKRLLTINKRNVIRWNIYRDNNFHSRRQVLKRL